MYSRKFAKVCSLFHSATYLNAYCSHKYLKMISLESVIENNNKSMKLVDALKSELTAIQAELLNRKKSELRGENARLQKQVESVKAELIALECRNGKKQIPLPGVRTLNTASCDDGKDNQPQQFQKKENVEKTKLKNEKKATKEKTQEKTNNAAIIEVPVDVRRLDLRIGKIVEVSRHPDADSLYVEKIDCGESQPRTVISGLVKFVPLEEMENRLVVVLCNLKPVKMRGILSEAMVMCASSTDKIEVLSPPENAAPGDLVHCEGFPREPDAQLNPKKKIFETCAPDLKTNASLVACFKGSPLHVPGKGQILAQTLKNVQVK
uniref:tRNA-binding domain-containing protein n=1 Tax=Glossina austeni TaxID=7395 RepID=A0A1A9UVK1_GLOAU